ncbi:MAG: carboxypeptidase-like regulatory domain-containing protein [Ekhidna sp.]|nr:carboxypeptidase-like regulatory domain-containing protein [Ekhidna sp.]
MRLTFTGLVFLFTFYLQAQRDYIYGSVTDSASKESIPSAHLKNLSAGLVTNSNSTGSFKIPAKIGDTLIVTHIGYESLFHITSAQDFIAPVIFLLQEKTSFLSEVEVNVFPEYVRFKEKILETEPEKNFRITLPKVVISYQPPTAEEMQNPVLAPQVGILFNLEDITKKGREKKKLKKLLAQKAVHQKFDRRLVQELTNLEGKELTDFMDYCGLSTKYLSRSTLFEINEKVIELYSKCKSQQEGENQDT